MEVEVRFPPGAKPHEAASKDAGRPHLGGVWIVPKDDGAVAISSNSYILAEVPVEVVGDLPTDDADHPLWLPSDVVKDTTRPARVENAVRVTDATYEPVKQPSKKRRGSAEHRKVFIERQPVNDSPRIIGHGALWPDHSKNTLRVGLNAGLLFDLSRALGGHMQSVSIEFDLDHVKDGFYMKPMIVRPLGNNEARGIIMPVRLNV